MANETDVQDVGRLDVQKTVVRILAAQKARDILNPLFQRIGEMVKDFDDSFDIVERAKAKTFLLEIFREQTTLLFDEQIGRSKGDVVDAAMKKNFSGNQTVSRPRGGPSWSKDDPNRSGGFGR